MSGVCVFSVTVCVHPSILPVTPFFLPWGSSSAPPPSSSEWSPFLPPSDHRPFHHFIICLLIYLCELGISCSRPDRGCITAELSAASLKERNIHWQYRCRHCSLSLSLFFSLPNLIWLLPDAPLCSVILISIVQHHCCCCGCSSCCRQSGTCWWEQVPVLPTSDSLNYKACFL